jgi:hypothetical protein
MSLLHFLVITGHSRSKNGVASLAYDPVIHLAVRRKMDCRVKPGNDEEFGAAAVAFGSPARGEGKKESAR